MSADEEKAIEWFKYLQATRQEQVRQQAWVGTNTFDAIDIVLNLIKKQKEELEKKDKIIDELAFELYINNIFDCDYKHFKDNKCKIKYPNVPNEKDCKQCIIDYFTKKVEE